MLCVLVSLCRMNLHYCLNVCLNFERKLQCAGFPQHRSNKVRLSSLVLSHFLSFPLIFSISSKNARSTTVESFTDYKGHRAKEQIDRFSLPSQNPFQL